MVMALGMTRLLSVGVLLFRSRGRVQMDWVPIVWACSIFYSMLDFSWDLRQPNGHGTEWTFMLFLVVFGFALLLFAAAALILPSHELKDGEKLRAAFERDGRWALLFIAVYDALAVIFNCLYWDASLFSMDGAVNLALAGLALCALRSSARKLECAATAAYAMLILSSGTFMT